MPGHRGDAFNKGSPPPGLAFHDGNATAAEICAYCPHWIKSVNVVDRFITNGGAQRTIAAMINEFRNVPQDAEFTPNSVQVMMSNNMRRAGYLNWTVGKHKTFNRPAGGVGPANLHVGNFQTPDSTHPTHTTRSVPEVPFISLGKFVKKHPSGDDALDLARCVQYALRRPHVSYMFPRDFKMLTTILGGPALVTPNHLDLQSFTRRKISSFTSSSRQPAAQGGEKPRSQQHAQDHDDNIKYEDNSEATQLSHFNIMNANDRRKSGRLATRAATSMRDHDSDVSDVDNVNSPYAETVTPKKRRKVSRIPPTPGSPDDSDFAAEGVSDIDDEFQDGEMASGDDDLFSPARNEKKRAAAHKARQVIHNLTTETQRNIKALKRKRSVQSSRAATPLGIQLVPATMFWDGKPRPAGAPIPIMPVPSDLAALGAKRIPLAVVNEQILTQARTYDPNAMPVKLNPPNLGGRNNYVSIDETNVRLFAAEGCKTEEEMWLSAFSYDRFKGPRRHPPFRELYRIVGPPDHDVSDFAENIRWAKQQKLYHGSETWREYDYDLEVIKDHRMQTNWVSEQKIMYGVYAPPRPEYEGYPY